ncbi:unnamed protein product [Rhizoctonia solani]|uniref:DUF7918 domain-containing protein n=1 Tax=Rhizoctonia solani TaxID=456999 RepID=A0A8H3CTJ0_9AGAM|nr:unnamed protein product [Rhizoctonia solani]
MEITDDEHGDGEVIMGVDITDSAGECFPEYGWKNLDDSTAHCWIPAVDGKNFEIRWYASGPESYSGLDVKATPYLDGEETDCGILMADERAENLRGWLDGHQVGVKKTRPFQFATLELTDNQAKAEQVHPEDLHTIRVELEWGRSQPQNTRLKKTRPKFSKPKTKGPIYEKMVKTGNHSCARLGSPVPSEPLPYARPFCPVKTNVGQVTFIFRYASADWLQANAVKINQAPNANNDKEIIDVDQMESEPELEQQPGPETEMEDNSMDELQVEAMIIMSSDPSNNNEVKSEPDDSVDQVEGTAISHSNINRGPRRPEVKDPKTNKIKSESENEAAFNQPNDEVLEDDDVFIYKIMVPVSNLRLPGEDIKVKLESSPS